MAQLIERVGSLRNQALDLARESLDGQDLPLYRALVDVAERLAAAEIRVRNQISGNGNLRSDAPASSQVMEIFFKHKGARHVAQLDKSRIADGTGACVFIDGEWLSTSIAGMKFTGYNVNGWRVWKYQRPDGRIAMIDELRRM